MLKPEELQSIKQRFGIIGNSSLLNHAVEVAVQVAATDMTVLINGESGSGKESFSKIIHTLSNRKHGQFIAINCGAIPEGTIDSELFGHEKGSFTGALDARKGYFEVTNGGTIFLDEIGEMPLGTQARLLRVLENGEFIKVGSSKVQKTDVRVVAATNVDLLNAVSKGKFREDLYYRLSTVPIKVPSLRDRGEDTLLLFRKFASDFSEKYREKPVSLTDDAKKALLNYRFPGNIRQLKNIVDQISVLETNREINAATLANYLPQNQKSQNMGLLKLGMESDANFSERDILYKVLFDMKKDMNELKTLVLSLMKGNEMDSLQLFNQHKELFNDVLPINTSESALIADNSATVMPVSHDIEEEEVEDVTHEVERESLSIAEMEKELILKALKKHKNKRKYASQDLGISERTLYRKLIEYNIEN
jgi:transcriptional regulator with PAS, ATPase and Fis domain